MVKVENEIYKDGLKRVKNNPCPKGQKFKPGTRVRIAKDLGQSMNHFPSGVDATVQYTYDHAYGCGDIKSYSLYVDGFGEVAWYDESQLTEIK